MAHATEEQRRGFLIAKSSCSVVRRVSKKGGSRGFGRNISASASERRASLSRGPVGVWASGGSVVVQTLPVGAAVAREVAGGDGDASEGEVDFGAAGAVVAGDCITGAGIEMELTGEAVRV